MDNWLLGKSWKAEAWMLFTHLFPPFPAKWLLFWCKHTKVKSGAAASSVPIWALSSAPSCAPSGAFPRFLNPPWTPESCRSIEQVLPPLQKHCPSPDGCISLCPLPMPASPGGAVGPWPAGCCLKDPFHHVHSFPPSSASLCWSQMFTFTSHAVSRPETLISLWQSNKAFPRILHATQPHPALLGSPLASVAAGSMEKRD